MFDELDTKEKLIFLERHRSYYQNLKFIFHDLSKQYEQLSIIDPEYETIKERYEKTKQELDQYQYYFNQEEILLQSNTHKDLKDKIDMTKHSIEIFNQIKEMLEKAQGYYRSALNMGLLDIMSDKMVFDIIKYDSLQKAQYLLQLVKNMFLVYEKEIGNQSNLEIYHPSISHFLIEMDLFDIIGASSLTQYQINQSEKAIEKAIITIEAQIDLLKDELVKLDKEEYLYKNTLLDDIKK